MKLPSLLALACLGILGLSSNAQASDSKRTAEYLLTTPVANEGKEVTLDVSFVTPVHWKSPLPDVAFFHAMTIDRNDRKPGGEIMVAIPSAKAEAFARKYGTDFKGRNDMNSLKGVFTALGGGEGRGPRTWIIDSTDGLLQKAIAEHKFSLPPDAGGPGEHGGPGGPGGHRPFKAPQN
ncbi:hypothetical protein BH09VER1_BH09VER1_19470 [soil metagenome]